MTSPLDLLILSVLSFQTLIATSKAESGTSSPSATCHAKVLHMHLLPSGFPLSLSQQFIQERRDLARKMGYFWTSLTYLHSLAGPVVMLMYPLYASVIAIETTSKVDDEQWLAYWILYSLFTLIEMALQPILNWIPIWYDMKLVFIAWLVLPQFRGAAFIYDRFVREKLKPYINDPSSSKGKNKFVDSISPKKVHEAY